jgi:hypothetical protein
LRAREARCAVALWFSSSKLTENNMAITDHGAYKTAANDLRLLVEDASVRQPTPNVEISHARERRTDESKL